MNTVLAIDPGVSGAYAIIRDGDLYEVADLPTIGNRVDHRAMRDVAARHRPWHVVIEELGARPRTSPQVNQLMGINYGVLIAAFDPWPLTIVRPQDWSKTVGRPQKLDYPRRKDWSRRRAIELWPDFYDKFNRKKDADRAEAALIGHAFWQTHDRRAA